MTATLVPTRTRALLVGFGIVLLARLAFLIWEPPYPLRPDALTPAYWPVNLFVGGPAFLLTFLGTAAFLAVLAPGVLGRVAGVLVAAGGILFSLVIVAEALPYAYATSAAEVERVNAATAQVVPIVVGTQIVIGVGVALGLVAVLLARSAPRWFPVVGLVYLVAFFALPFDLGIAGEILQTALLAGIAWFALRPTVS